MERYPQSEQNDSHLKRAAHQQEQYNDMFDPDAYLYQMCPNPGTGNASELLVAKRLKLFHDLFATGLHRGRTVLDLCSGPSIMSTMSISKYYEDIYLCEYTERNRDYLHKWLGGDRVTFDWTPHFNHVAELEEDGMTDTDIERRVRRSINAIVPCDVLKANILGDEFSHLTSVDAIISCFTIEAAAHDRESYHQTLCRMTQLLRPGGLFALLGALNETFFEIGGVHFDFVNVGMDFVLDSVKKAGFKDIYVTIFDNDWAEAKLGNGTHNFLLSAKKV